MQFGHKISELPGYTPPPALNERAARAVASWWIWAPMGAIFWAFFVFLTTQGSTYILTKGFRTAPGRFVKDLNRQAEFRYTFEVNGVAYAGEGSSGQHQFDDLQKGEPFNVYYQPNDPRVNSPDLPRKIGKPECSMGAVLAGMLTLALRGAAINLARIVTVPEDLNSVSPK